MTTEKKLEGDGFPRPMYRGEPVDWRTPELPPAPAPRGRRLPELDDAEIDLVRDAIAWSLGLSHTPPPAPGELEALLASGEAHRILGIVQEGGDEAATAHRVELAIVDFRGRTEAERRNAKP